MWLGTVHRLIVRRPGNGVLALALLLGSCVDPGDQPANPLAPSERPSAAATQKTAPSEIDVAPLAAVHKASPADPAAALAYARGLRQSGSMREAVAVLDKATALRPADRALLLERGLLALDLGDPAKAETLLRKAQDDKAPSWRLHSGLGTALASRGKQQEAQVEFAKALALAPDHPSILNNLALSYALDGKVEEAERLLRKARQARSAPDPGKVQQNLALVLGLRGKYEEARRASAGAGALASDKAQENVAYLQALASARPAVSEATSKTSEVKTSTVEATSKTAEASTKPAPAPDAPGFTLFSGLKPSASLPPPIFNLGGPKPADQ